MVYTCIAEQALTRWQAAASTTYRGVEGAEIRVLEACWVPFADAQELGPERRHDPLPRAPDQREPVGVGSRRGCGATGLPARAALGTCTVQHT